MKRLFVFFAVMLCVLAAFAQKFSYRFNHTPLADALTQIAEQHPDIHINFIYNELDKYPVTATVRTNDAYDMLRQLIGLNPVSVIRSKDRYYVEALQHGKFVYHGRVVSNDKEPVAGATVMLLAPKDSTVITYGIADADGRFSIPCDSRGVIAKLSCIGYRTTYRHCPDFNCGTIVMPVHTIKLGQVNVEAQTATVYTDKTVFIPTTRQKNASQTGADLIDHMGIPQLKVSLSGNISTNSGSPVGVYIDFIPASAEDLKAMCLADVRRVEYYENPTDPRMQGHTFAINYVMAKYEYGGYVKGMGVGNLLSYSEQLLANVRLQKKKMTYDLMGYGFNSDHSHTGSELTETFRLPQPDSGIKTFDRYSKTTSSKDSHQQYFAAFRATYNSDHIKASTQINGSIDRRPKSDRSGTVTYTATDYPASEYTSALFNSSKFISYSGYYFFSLPKSNTLTFTPKYMYSHTQQNSSYLESGYAPILNNATDNTNQLRADLKYTHDFGKYGNILTFVRGSYEYNRTRYTGSVESYDSAKTSRIGVGANYNINVGDFRGSVGCGWDWDRLQFGDLIDKPSAPWFDLSLRYTIKQKHSLSTVFHYSTWAPDPSYKSENIISATYLLSYTGNPALVPDKSYDLGLFYSWYPNNNYSFSAFATSWIMGDRYVYDYEATPTGILRTIKQPLGSFMKTEYGISATLRFLNRNLVFTGEISHQLNHNGTPYNINHSYIDWYARVRYYLNDWNFSLTYISDQGKPDGAINGIWVKTKNDWYLTIGWANTNWNVKANILNMTRWNWRSDRRTMHSKYYDTVEQVYNGSSHALIQLTATYTFGFGKKVNCDNEPSVSGSAASAILK